MTSIAEAATDGGSSPGHAGEAAAALPRLAGWKFGLFRIIWFVAFALAAGGTIAGVHYQSVRYDRIDRPIEDLGLQISSPGTLGAPVGSEARAAGIVPGLRLIAIDGRPLPPGARWSEIAPRVDRPEGAQVRIRTRSPEGLVREHVLTRSRSHVAEAHQGSGISAAQRRLVQLIADLAAAAVNIVAAIMLFRRRARDPVAATLSLAFLLLVMGWGAAWDTFSVLGVIELPISARAIGYGGLLAGMAVFPEGRLESRWRRAVLAAIALWVFAILVDVADPFDVPDNLLYLSFIVLLAGSVASLWGRYRRLPMGAARQQIRWALLGFAIGGGLGSTVLLVELFGAVNPYGATGIWVNILLWIVGAIGFAFLSLGLLVSLLKYRLYDADAAISRSAGYAVLTLMLGATFAASAKVLEWLFEAYFGGQAGALPGAIGAGLAVVLITPMHRRIQDWAERRFQKALLHLRRDLPDCVGDLRETAGMAELLDELLARVETGTRAVRSAVVMDGEMVAARGGEGDYPLSIPLRIGHREAEIGTLLVGPRPDGSAPGKDEREALAEIADPIARAIQIVATREIRQAETERRFAALEQAVLGKPKRRGPRLRKSEV
jgi:hypothetical protein